VFVPARTVFDYRGGRPVEYTFDAQGYRVRRPDQPVDIERPAIIFAGESVMFGDGLEYDETIPAQVESMLRVPAVNTAVYGFSTGQVYLKLQADLARLRHPLAVVALFMTALLGRNLDDDRPSLGPGLVWRPPRHRARIVSLATLLVPFRREATVENGIQVTRDTLLAIVHLARSRGATPLIVVPHIGHEESAERGLRHRLLDDPGVPYVFVELDPAWHLPWDRHPDARAAYVIAGVVADRLRQR
jgi:hypothetical protein